LQIVCAVLVHAVTWICVVESHEAQSDKQRDWTGLVEYTEPVVDAE
jgi:hypothetical protein